MTLPLRNARIKLSQGQIFWRETGQGDAIVFLHGSWWEGSQWLPVIDLLKPSYHCLVPDLLGFGESEQPPLPYSIHLEVECLAEYLAALRLRQVYLVGHSLGAWVAASYALKYPDQVRGLVLLSPEGLQVQGLGRRWALARWLLGKPPLFYWVLRSLRFLVRPLGWHQGVDRVLQFRRQLRQAPVACRLLFKRRWAEVKAESLQTRLEWLQAPALILQSQADGAAASLLGQAFARLAPQAKLQQLPGSSSDLLQTQPERVAQAIRESMQKQG